MQEVLTVSRSENQMTMRYQHPQEMPKPAGHKLAVFCDFDGTITVGDVVDILLEKHADPQWRLIEKRWENGEIDDCECMSQQIRLIRGSWSDIVSTLDTIQMDAHFKSFAEKCRQSETPLYVGSNGLDKVISYFFEREGIEVDGLWAYQLTESNGFWSLQFPKDAHRKGCRVAHSIACKCSLLESTLIDNQAGINTYNIVIGDGRSDFCWVNKANFVFAKSKLAQYCLDNQLDHVEFDNFADINQYLNEMNRFCE
jgi:2-hydroxy-3-keto-5-methylthiopentenyl-1-phosphate phosphatase